MIISAMFGSNWKSSFREDCFIDHLLKVKLKWKQLLVEKVTNYIFWLKESQKATNCVC